MNQPGNLPKWLYEALPYAYIAGAFTTVGMTRNAIGLISGVLLLSAGALVLSMRHSYRVQHQRPEEPAPRAARAQAERNGDDDGELLQVAWRSSFEIGHDVIDRQHRRLLNLGNELNGALLQHKPREDVELMLDVLVTDVGTHLKQEDELTGGNGTPQWRRVREAHRALLAAAVDMRDRYRAGDASAGELVGFVAYDLIAMHVVKEDLRFAPGERARPAFAPRHRRGSAEQADSLG
jgi:hemerythrin-like metal-binding protein